MGGEGGEEERHKSVGLGMALVLGEIQRKDTEKLSSALRALCLSVGLFTCHETQPRHWHCFLGNRVCVMDGSCLRPTREPLWDCQTLLASERVFSPFLPLPLWMKLGALTYKTPQKTMMLL